MSNYPSFDERPKTIGETVDEAVAREKGELTSEDEKARIVTEIMAEVSKQRALEFYHNVETWATDPLGKTSCRINVPVDLLEEWLQEEKKLKNPKLRDLSSSEAYEFFRHTAYYYLKLLDDHAKDPLKPEVQVAIAGQRIEQAYLEPTDRLFLDPEAKLKDLDFTFKEMVFHSQNGAYKVDFDKHEGALNVYFKGYAFDRFASDFDPDDEAGEIDKMDRAGLKGLRLHSFFLTVKSIVGFLKGHSDYVRWYICGLFGSYKENHGDFFYELLYKRFRKEVPNGFGEALVFDFLKEYDPQFDLPKPDLHMKRTIAALYLDDKPGTKGKYWYSQIKKKDIESIRGPKSAMSLFVKLIREINSGLENEANTACPPIPNYVLDKMIYIVCSGMLYLHDIPEKDPKYKSDYLKEVLNRDFSKSAHLSWRDILAILP